jgi:hypothetical protein
MINANTNCGCELPGGRIIAQWEDDDWYAHSRLSAQATHLLAGIGQISGSTAGVLLDLDLEQFWRCTPPFTSASFLATFIVELWSSSSVFSGRTCPTLSVTLPDKGAERID